MLKHSKFKASRTVQTRNNKLDRNESKQEASEQDCDGLSPSAGKLPTGTLRSNSFLERAMHQWGNAVLRLALNQMRNPADAEDVFQDVFLRLLKDRTLFTDGEHLKAWLLRVTINRCHDLQRSGQRRRHEPLDEQHAFLEAPELFASDIWEIVGELPADLRTVVHLFYVEGYSTDEIARITECAPPTVRSRLYRARGLLRSSLENTHTTESSCGNFIQKEGII